MTMPGSAGLGTAYGKVRIDYESHGATKAVKDVEALHQSVVNTGKDFGAISKGAAAATASVSKFTKQAHVKGPVKLTATEIIFDQGAFNAAMQSVKMDPVVVRVPIVVDPDSVDTGGIQSAVQKATKGVAGANSGIMGKLAGLGGASALLGRFGAIGAAAGAATAAAGALSYVLGSGFQRLQGLDAAATKLAALKLNTEQIAAVKKSALASVEDTGFALEDAFSAAATAINSGIQPGQKLDAYLMALSNTAALAGTSMTDLGDSFSQAAITGKLTGDIVQSLQARQVPYLKAIAEEYGVTQQAASAMVSNGEVDFERFIHAMGANKDAARIMGNTVASSFANMQTAIRRVGAALLAPLFGEATGDISLMAEAIQFLTGKIKEFEGFLKAHRADIVGFWAGLAQAAVTAAEFVHKSIVDMVKDLAGMAADAAGFMAAFDEWTTSLGPAGKKIFGDNKEEAESLRKFQKNMEKLQEAAEKGTDTDIWDKSRKAIEAWKNVASAGAVAAGNALESAAPKTKKLAEALEELKIKSEAANAAITGSTTEFNKFIKSLEKQGKSKEVIETLKQLRAQWVQGGPQVRSFAEAVERFADATASADSKAEGLISSMQDLGLLAKGDALDKFSQKVRDLTSFESDLLDKTDTLGNSLANADGSLNTANFANASKLRGALADFAKDYVALVASGEASPQAAYDQATATARDMLIRQGGMDEATANKVISKYIPNTDQIAAYMEANGNPQDAANKLLGNDPLKLDSVINLLTQKDDIVNNIVGPDGKLHIPTVLDTEAPAAAGAAPKPGEPGFVGPVDVSAAPAAAGPAASAPKTPADKIRESIKRRDEERAAAQRARDEEPWWKKILPQAGTQFKWPGDQWAKDQPLTDQETAALKDNDLVKQVFAQDDNLRMMLDQRQHQYEAQGKSLAEAYAEGVLSGEPYLREAIKRLAQIAADGLGASPAKYGPLSGKGWTYYRGQTFTSDWSRGIVSQADSAKEAVSSTATMAVEPLGDQLTKMVSDLQEFSDFGKHLFSFVQQMADMSFGILKFANDASGGRLFPKNYVPITDAKKKGSALGPWNPGGGQFANPFGGGGAGPGGGRPGAPGPLAANAGQQQIADYIITKAMAEGYSREQANQFVVQAFGESHLNPNASNPAGWEGIFQFDKPTWALAGGGDVKNAQQNIDNYFNLAKIRNLTPGSFTAGSQLGTQVSIGGPWHPENAAKGHLSAATAGAQKFIDAYVGQVQSAIVNAGPQGDTGAGRGAPTVPPPDEKTIREWVAKNFGMPSTFGTGSWENASHDYDKGWHHMGQDLKPGGAKSGYGFDFSGTREQMTALANWIAQNYVGQTLELIYQGAGFDPANLIKNAKKGTGAYDASTLADHASHVHWAVTTIPGLGPTVVPLDGPGSPGSPAGSPRLPGPAAPAGTQAPVPVQLDSTSSQHLSNIATNTNSMPSMPAMLQDLANQNPALQQAISSATSAGGITSENAVAHLRAIDSAIADQNELKTPESKQVVAQLEGIRQNVMGQAGLQEGQGTLDQAQTIATSISGVVSDGFAVFDATLKSIASAKEIGDILVRGIENTGNISTIIDQVQSFIDLGAKIAQFSSSVLGMVGQIVGMAGSSGSDSGGSMAAAQALSMASTAAGFIGQGLSAMNTAIDLVQEGYKITTKYITRGLEAWFGLPGASDIKYLLDTVSGQLKVYTSENPEDKKTFNTFGRQVGAMTPGERAAPTNQFYIYQGPGQDPRDTMSDAMFTVKSSGVGAFGYAY